MTKNNFNIELFPQGVFVITLLDGKKIRGRFSMYALNRFCEAKGVNYLQAIGKITLGMTIKEYAELIVFALEDLYREDFELCRHNEQRWTVAKVMDDILDPMGLGTATALSFFEHAVGRLGQIMGPAETIDKKKAAKKK